MTLWSPSSSRSSPWVLDGADKRLLIQHPDDQRIKEPANAAELRGSAAVNEMWRLWNKAGVSLWPRRGDADVRAHKGGRAEAVKYGAAAAPVCSLDLHSEAEPQPSLFCVFKQRKHTHLLCVSEPHFHPYWVGHTSVSSWVACFGHGTQGCGLW